MIKRKSIKKIKYKLKKKKKNLNIIKVGVQHLVNKTTGSLHIFLSAMKLR